METKVVDLANCAIIALETQVTDLEGQRVTVDRRVAEVAEHVEIPAAGWQVWYLLVRGALAVNVDRGYLDDG